MSPPSRLGNFVFELLPHENQLFYRFCRKVFHRANADNDDDIRTNGERVLMHRVLPKATVVFDAGANVGDWTAEALSINAQAQYHVFEPSPTTFGYLQRRSFPANVMLNNAGLGAAEGGVDLFVFGDGLGSNSLYDRRGDGRSRTASRACGITTLDAYCAGCNIERIDFLKIDVEGHELQVLRGAAELLRARRIGVIQFEYGGAYIDARGLLKDVWDLIGELDPHRAFFKLHHDGPRHVAAYRQELETFQHSNWVIATNDEIVGLQS